MSSQAVPTDPGYPLPRSVVGQLSVTLLSSDAFQAGGREVTLLLFSFATSSGTVAGFVVSRDTTPAAHPAGTSAEGPDPATEFWAHETLKGALARVLSLGGHWMLPDRG